MHFCWNYIRGKKTALTARLYFPVKTSLQKVEEEWRWRDRWSVMLITTKNINKNWNFQTREFQWNLTISNKFMKKYIMKPFTVIFWPNRVGVSKQAASPIWLFRFLFYWIINNLDTRQDTVGGLHFSGFLLPNILDIKHLLGWIWFNFQTIPSFCPLVILPAFTDVWSGHARVYASFSFFLSLILTRTWWTVRQLNKQRSPAVRELFYQRIWGL